MAPRPSLFNDNKWHKVDIIKRNRIVTLSCDGGDPQQLTSDIEIPFVNTKYGVKLGSLSMDSKTKPYLGDISHVSLSQVCFKL